MNDRPPQAQLDHERDRIERALVRLANKGEPFTVSEVWARVRVESPKWHASWIGRKTQLLCDEGLIEFTGEWEVTPLSERKSRASRVWQLSTVVRRQREAA